MAQKNIYGNSKTHMCSALNLNEEFGYLNAA